MLLEKEPAGVALHKAISVLDRTLLLLSNVVSGLVVHGKVIGRCSNLGTIPFVECSNHIGHYCCAIVRHHLPWNAKRRRERTQDTDDRCRSRTSRLSNFEPLCVRVDHDQEDVFIFCSGEVNIRRVPLLRGFFPLSACGLKPR